MDWPLFHYIMTLSLFDTFSLKPTFSDKTILPLLLWGYYWYLLEIFFSISSLSVYVSLRLKWESRRQHIVGSYYFFFINSAILYLLIAEFNTFMFKIIINMYRLTIAILLIVFWLFCKSILSYSLTCFFCVLMFCDISLHCLFINFFCVVATGFYLVITMRLT